MSHLLAPIAEWIRDVVEGLGYAGIAFLILLENLIPPIPSELVLPFAGYLIDQGVYSPLGVLTAATTGSVVGALILYGLGAWFGEERVRGFVRRFGRWLFLREADVDRAEVWFIRHGAKAVLFGRLVPVVRSLVSLPAGVARMPLLQFVLFTT
nr:DedA family protein [Chloroflexota bacterium]